MRSRTTLALAIIVLAPPAAAEAPLSAIDWLSDSLVEPALGPALPEPVEVRPLAGEGAPVGNIEALSPRVGSDLWAASQNEDVIRSIERLPRELPPPLADLLADLLLLSATPPRADDGTFLLTRIDRLMAMARLNDALALIEAATGGGAPAPDLFRRRFDIQLLTGNEDFGCHDLEQRPDISPTYPARIFCLARGGDWPAAALTLESADALGALDKDQDAILARFLDDGIENLLPPPRTPSRVTPLDFRIFEAIGEPLPANVLPLPFAHAELRGNVGWKARIEAAERLARSGAIAPDRLIALYLERQPAASGGIWDRARAIRELDRAVAAGEPEEAAAALDSAYGQLAQAGLLHALAETYAADLARLLPQDARVQRLSQLAGSLQSPQELLEAAGGDDPNLSTAIRSGWNAADPSGSMQRLIDEGRAGEALLTAIGVLAQGADADPADFAAALRTLRHYELDESARRASAWLLLAAG